MPCTPEEIASVPAVKALMSLLNFEAQTTGSRESLSSTRFSEILNSPPDSDKRSKFMDTAGLSIITWIRNLEAHKFFVTDELPRAGLSSAVVKEVVQAALGVIVQDCSAQGFSLDHMGVLTRLPSVTKKAV